MRYAAYLDADFIPLPLISLLLQRDSQAVLYELLNSLSRLSLI